MTQNNIAPALNWTTSKVWTATRVIDLKVGDTIATDFVEGFDESVYEEYVDGYDDAVITKIDVIRTKDNKATLFTITVDTGETIDVLELDGCYCGCRDSIHTIVITPEEE